MAPPSALDRAIIDRDINNDLLDYITAQIAADVLNPLFEPEVDHLLRLLKTVQGDLVENHRKILLCNPPDRGIHTTALHELSRRASQLLNGLTGMKNRFAPQGPAPLIPNAKGPETRLPRLELPIFEGHLHQWVTFRDMFTTSIHNKASLSNSEKLTYLKSLVKGDAARLVSTLVVSDANYDIAWTKLIDRYQNERELVFAIFQRFIAQPNLQSASAKGIRDLVDVSMECVKQLEVFNINLDKGLDAMCLFLLFRKLDDGSKQLWEQQQKDTKIPSLQSLLDFLEQRARAFSAAGCSSTKSSHQGSANQNSTRVLTSQGDKPRQQSKPLVHHTQSNCPCCPNATHPLWKCPTFLHLSVPSRIEMVKKAQWCFNCLLEGHSCSSCTSSWRCRTCQKKHHSLLHRNTQPDSKSGSSSDSQNFHSTPMASTSPKFDAILATAIVMIPDRSGQQQPCRVLVDSGSNTNYVSEACVTRLGFTRTKCNTDSVGLGGEPVGTSTGFTAVSVFSKLDPSSCYDIKALIVKRITNDLPMINYDHAKWTHLSNLQLADPQWFKPQKVDMLLGAEIFFSILKDGKMCGQPGAPIAQNSEFGWLIGGGSNLSKRQVTPMPLLTKTSRVNDDATDSLLRKFWEIEEVPYAKILTQEEEMCEQHFLQTYSRNQSGRFTVSLPFKSPEPSLGHSLPMATRRLQQIERRLQKEDKYKHEYCEFMQEYEALGHMVQVTPAAVDSNSVSYIPHHFVLKDSSTTTKFRVVFDASAKTSNGTSLNDALMVGPTIQDSLVDILMRFRLHKIAFTADIAKMYRQIQVTRVNRPMQRILWRDDPSKPIKHYELLTVTYGTAPAPFLATRVLQQLATLEEAKFPKAAAILKQDFYVDDLMSGAPTEKEALIIQQQLLNLTTSGGFSLRKWTSNSQLVLDSLPPELRETTSLLQLDMDSTVKALGVFWNPATDTFVFKISDTFSTCPSSITTKRQLLSQIAKLFDPVGWLAPVIITAKILMQQVWKENVGWDTQLPLSITTNWDHFKKGLVILEQLNIPRFHLAGFNLINPFYTCIGSSVKVCLVGFCDASERAYSGVVYLCVYQDSRPPAVSLITSKTRVSPCKTISLPRLELCGSLLLAELIVAVKSAHHINFHSVTAYTDSTVALGWIQGHPARWKTFVANRVTKIQNIIPGDHWGHVSGIDNPADCASRGIDAADLINHPLWWKGPAWLHDSIPTPSLPSSISPNSEECVKEERKEKTCTTTISTPSWDFIEKFSDLHKLLRVTAYMMRFINNSRVYSKSISDPFEQQSCPVESTRVETLSSSVCGLEGDSRILASRAQRITSDQISTPTPIELECAMLRLVKFTQQTYFTREYVCLSNGLTLSHKSAILSLHPFLDKGGVLRVGGRLRNADIHADRKTPILLPRHSSLTQLIIQATHIDNLHAGPQLMQSIISQKFWILRARDTIRFQIKKCVLCAKFAAKMQQQFMGDLPGARVNPARPFLKCGVDFAGPFLLKTGVPRSKTTLKGYLAIFVCFVTRSIHVEVVSDLSTSGFQAALRRFVSRRGRPSDIYSDCGTNFVGTARELKEWTSLSKSNQFNNSIATDCSRQGIRWHFNPPGAPHFGGLFEAGVKSVKYHLKRIMGDHRFSFEELYTCICQIEACLNSRPLTAASSDPNDLTALTPGHFLIGAPLNSVTEPDLTSLKTGHLDRWQLVQQMQQHFWQRWSSEYLNQLQPRPKWASARSDLKVGDLVIIKDERMPPQQWKLGRIIILHPGKDNISRVATLRTADGELKRPFVKLCLLPITHD